ncbi:MAG: hypothetical protein ACXV2H_03570 [Actinomycetes bacterium]
MRTAGRPQGDVAQRPAFYAMGSGTGGLRDWVTLLHPPYTAWHLSYVAIGAALAPHFALWRLAGTLVAFFLAVGVGAHALDELVGRPLRTGIATPTLLAAAAVGVTVPVVVGLFYGGWRLLPFVVTGAVLVVGYNLELGHGVLHNAVGFALGWGAFPLLTGFYAQSFQLSIGALVAAGAAFLLSLGQRTLSLPVRALRRRTLSVQGRIASTGGGVTELDRDALLAPLEGALQCVAGGLVCLAVAMVLSR